MSAAEDLSGCEDESCGCVWEGVPLSNMVSPSLQALAEEFLRAGDDVLICSRKGEVVTDVVQEMQAKYAKRRVVVSTVFA